MRLAASQELLASSHSMRDGTKLDLHSEVQNLSVELQLRQFYGVPPPQDLTIRNILYNTPINNSEQSWNCQHWITDGLRRLQEADIIPENIVNNAADQMVDTGLPSPTKRGVEYAVALLPIASNMNHSCVPNV
jgi:hypothetical protein